MALGPILRKYGVEATFNFDLYEIDGIDLKVDAAHAAGDTNIMKDEGAEAATDNAFVDEGQGYSIVLTATEMQAARIVAYIVDQGTKAWLDRVVVIETYGNASAQHAFDLDTANQDVNIATWLGVAPSALDGGRVQTLCDELATQAKADVNVEANDVINVDAQAEAAAVPAANASIGDKVNFLMSFARNGGAHNRNTGNLTVNNDAGAAIGTATVADSGGATGTLTRGKMT